MSKVLGVDFGDRRTGIAISDASRTIAFPRETLFCDHPEQAAAAVARLAAAEAVAEIVVGYPPGGSTDVLARGIAAAVQEALPGSTTSAIG